VEGGVVDSALPLLLYDGDCGLCHGFVKYVLVRDSAALFSFSPLQGDTITRYLDESERADLPDSVVLITENRTLLLQSDAVRYVLQRLPGRARFWAGCIGIFPRVLRDFGYGLVARVRKQIFAKPEGVCPLIPAELRTRFLD
jgi:predicted DCC family thiol-disulfide oxidoreductase YuxK